MKVSSMTGFAASELIKEKYRISWELKSVNNRFKDFRFRTPNVLNPQEIFIRKKIDKIFSRGSFDISCQIQKISYAQSSSNIDYEKVKNFVQEFEREMEVSNLKFSPISFLRSEFQKQEDESEKDTLVQDAMSCLDELFQKLQQSRQEEGAKLKEVFEAYMQKCSDNIKSIEKLAKNYQKDVQNKLQEKFAEKTKDLDVNIDEERFNKELIYYLERLDVDEEIKRAGIHLGKLKRLFQSDEDKPIGRELEFTLQELNRETNTIGSKSGHEEISSLVVDTKVILEKMREQALNIE